MDDLDLGPLLEELARAALDHRRVGRDCCAQQLDQVWIRLSRAAAGSPRPTPLTGERRAPSPSAEQLPAQAPT